MDILSTMPGYGFSRIYLAPGPRPSLPEVLQGVAGAFWRARRYDVLHVHGEVASGLCIPLLATRSSVVTLHGLHLTRRLHGLRRKAAVLNLRAVLRAADRTICVSQAEYDELTRLAGSVAARRAAVVHNGVRLPPPRSETDRAAVREELGFAQEEAVGIWIGSLDERKDPLAAVRAAERASVALLVVGDGPLRSHVERTARGSVRVLGRRADVPHLLAAADFYILTSRREGLALSLLEAMAHGLPPVVSGLAENIEAAGDAGIAVPLGDEGALVAALGRLVENETERAAFGQQARRRIAELFDAEKMIARTRAVYEEVLANRQP